nr:uncharacterized protein LOC124809436 [Hydra vulgaris]
MREPISVVKRVAVALHYLASCEEYRVVSSLFGIGKSTANLIVHEFINAVNDILLPKYVKFPLSVENLNKHSKDFEAILGFPQCYCRYRFIYTSVGSPGRNNDSYILQNSSLKAILESSLFDKCCKELGDSLVPLCLIGDSAFPLTRHLLKPYLENLELSEIQKNFNKILCGARRVVENAFGRVKARFRVICKRMECDINLATRIVNACVTLHNICEYYDDIIIIEWLMHHHDDSLAQPNTVSTTGNNGPEKNVCDSIAKHLYERDKGGFRQSGCTEEKRNRLHELIGDNRSYNLQEIKVPLSYGDVHSEAITSVGMTADVLKELNTIKSILGKVKELVGDGQRYDGDGQPW